MFLQMERRYGSMLDLPEPEHREVSKMPHNTEARFQGKKVVSSIVFFSPYAAFRRYL